MHCASHQQLHCVNFRMGQCDEKPIPGTFQDPNVRYGHIRRPEPVAKKNEAAAHSARWPSVDDDAPVAIGAMSNYTTRVIASPDQSASISKSATRQIGIAQPAKSAVGSAPRRRESSVEEDSTQRVVD
jgi:hypothetical protein